MTASTTSGDMPGTPESPRTRLGAIVPRAIANATAKRGRRRFVRFMKFVLPMLAVALVAVIAAWPQWMRRDKGFQLTFSNVAVDDMALVMNNPRYRGMDGKGQPYVVTGERATQNPDNTKLVTIDKVAADITLEGGAWYSLSAQTGYYDGDARLMQLHGDINVYSDRGYEFHAVSAEIDLNTSVLSSDEKVWGQTSLGTIRANGMRVYDKGRTIVFINGVKTRLNPRHSAG